MLTRRSSPVIACAPTYKGACPTAAGSVRIKEAYYYDAYALKTDYGMSAGNFTAYSTGAHNAGDGAWQVTDLHSLSCPCTPAMPPLPMAAATSGRWSTQH